MGTVVSIDVRDPDPSDPAIARAIEEAVAWLHEVDARFSPFREASEIRRLDRGELALDDCHPDVRHVLRACEDLRAATGGAFDAARPRSGRPARPVGLRQGLGGRRGGGPAGRRPAHVPSRSTRAATSWCGARRRRAGPGAWASAIRPPPTGSRRSSSLADGAVATSGLYERGGHVRDPRSGRVPDAYASVVGRRADAGPRGRLGHRRPGARARRPGARRGRAGARCARDRPRGVATWSDLVDGLLR